MVIIVCKVGNVRMVFVNWDTYGNHCIRVRYFIRETDLCFQVAKHCNNTRQ